jgi:long-subunit acyl-CoA synthetase (AMP-forming)
MKEPWTMQNGLLTPTMKIQRQKVEDTYVDEFEKWKKQNRKIVWV